MKRAVDNKFLIVKPGVILTGVIESVIVRLDEFFESEGLKAYVTSGVRTAEDQIRIIRNALIARKLNDEYPDAFKDKTEKIRWEGNLVYAWQPGWSRLLKEGFIVNPPYTAQCLMDYYRPGSSENRKGRMIGQSPHTKGYAFDIGGGADGIHNELKVIQKAFAARVGGLAGYLPEHGNNCVHCDCR